MEKENLLASVGNKSLSAAEKLLDKETAPTGDTVETVKKLVDTAISIDLLNLQWAAQTRSGAAVFRGQSSSLPKEEN